MERFAISLFANEKDNAPRPAAVTWEDVVSSLRVFDATDCAPCAGHDCAAKRGEAWSPARFAGDGRRSNANVSQLSLAVFDLDKVDAAGLEALWARLDGWQYVAHSTHAYAPPALASMRLVLRPSRPILAREWPAVWAGVVAHFQLPADAQCTDLQRLYFFPSHARGGPELSRVGHGRVVDVDSFLSRPGANPPAPAAPGAAPSPGAAVFSPAIDLAALRLRVKTMRPEARALLERVIVGQAPAAPGARDATLNRIAGALAFAFVPSWPEEAAAALLEPSLRAMEGGEGYDHWAAEFRDMYVRAVARAGETRAKEAREAAEVAKLLPAGAVEDEPDPGWEKQCVTTTAKDGSLNFVPCEATLEAILRNDPDWRGGLLWDAVRKTIEFPAGPLKGCSLEDGPFAAAVWFQRSRFRLKTTAFSTRGALLRVARLHPRDGIRDYLRDIRWDGTPRGGSFLSRLLHVPDSALLGRLGLKWLMGAAARGLWPGCKMDNVLILTGEYGAKKSSFVEVMAGEWYSNGRIDFDNKDSRALCARYWIVEIAEMAGYGKAESERVKDWFSTKVDSYRVPYGVGPEDFPRRAVFVGTANDSDFLVEPNRREWPVAVADIDVQALKAERDQLFAEAVARLDASGACPACAAAPFGRCPEHSWWFDGEEMVQLMSAAKKFGAPSPLAESIADWWMRTKPDKRPRAFTALQVVMEAFGLERQHVQARHLREASKVLGRMGFARSAREGPTGRTAVFRPTEALMAIQSLETLPDGRQVLLKPEGTT